MSSVVDLVTGALRHKLTQSGAGSMSRVEWQLLRVATLLHALDAGALERTLSTSPLAEVRGMADALEAIGAAEASIILHLASRGIEAANGPGRAPERASTLQAIAQRLDGGLGAMRTTIEAKLLEFAFRQPELAAELDAAALRPDAGEPA